MHLIIQGAEIETTALKQLAKLSGAGGIEARHLRTLGTQTFLISVLAGFVAGLFAGRMLRRRFLAQPGTIAPPS